MRVLKNKLMKSNLFFNEFESYAMDKH